MPDTKDTSTQLEAAGAGSPARGLDDDQLLAWLASSRRVKGRGDIGPRVEGETGPYLPVPPGGMESAEKVARGPARPQWLPSEAAAQRPVPNAGFLRAVMGAVGERASAAGPVQHKQPAPASSAEEEAGHRPKQKKHKKRSKEKHKRSSKSKRKHSSKKERKDKMEQ